MKGCCVARFGEGVDAVRVECGIAEGLRRCQEVGREDVCCESATR